MKDAIQVVENLKAKYAVMRPSLDELGRRRWGAVEARALGYGGIAAVHRATGMAIATIRSGIAALAPEAEALPEGRLRAPGGGRKPLLDGDPELRAALLALVEPGSRGDPESPLRWTLKSTAKLAAELTKQGHPVSPRKVAQLLKEEDFSLQANRKKQEGRQDPDRDGQFRYIARRVKGQQRVGQPSLSVDAKKKETLGNLKNPGPEWRPKGDPRPVKTHDFPDPTLGKVTPYAVYDMKRNEGFVSVGVSANTAEFAVAGLRRWHQQLGRERYPKLKKLLLTADSGGSNAARCRLWKWELQRLADELSVPIEVLHYPPGTSKWNKVEHRLLCQITRNWRGQPLVSHEVVVQLIAGTTTATGLVVRAELDGAKYEKGRKISDAEMATLDVRPHRFRGDWNYTIHPRKPKPPNDL